MAQSSSVIPEVVLLSAWQFLVQFKMQLKPSTGLKMPSMIGLRVSPKTSMKKSLPMPTRAKLCRPSLHGSHTIWLPGLVPPCSIPPSSLVLDGGVLTPSLRKCNTGRNFITQVIIIHQFQFNVDGNAFSSESFTELLLTWLVMLPREPLRQLCSCLVSMSTLVHPQMVRPSPQQPPPPLESQPQTLSTLQTKPFRM